MKILILVLLILTLTLIPFGKGDIYCQSFDAKTEVGRYEVVFFKVEQVRFDYDIEKEGKIRVHFVAPDKRLDFVKQQDMERKGKTTGITVNFDIGNGSVVYGDTSWFDIDYQLTPGFYEMAVRTVDKQELTSKFWAKSFVFLVMDRVAPGQGELMKLTF